MSEELVILWDPGEAAGAIPNGTRVVKVAGEPGDTHMVGDLATVIGSHGPLPEMDNQYAYFVNWDSHPDIPVFVSGYKLARYKQGEAP